MRPNQQNKRSRSRNSNRKNSNPLTRSYESNGPDVRVRGNAAHVAEKYVQLARDANSSGDSVAAENYLQHAEHYFRIISAAQAQMYTQPAARSEVADNRDAGDGDGAPGEAAPKAAKPAPQNVEESAEPVEREVRAPRQRRPRRSRVGEKPAAAAAGAPQPEVGELPSFVSEQSKTPAG